MIKSSILSKFQKKYNHHINYGLSFHTIKYVRENTEFDFDVFLETKEKNLQRGFCWNDLQKQSLIYTILRNHIVDPIVVVQTKDRGYSISDKNHFKVIDGKQRLTTVFSFIDNEFSIDIDGKRYYFKDLPEDCQKQILHYNFKWDVHYSYWERPIDDDTLISIFEDCNFLGAPQDFEHLSQLKQ